MHVGVSYRHCQQRRGDSMVEQNDARQRGHRIWLHRHPHLRTRATVRQRAEAEGRQGEQQQAAAATTAAASNLQQSQVWAAAQAAAASHRVDDNVSEEGVSDVAGVDCARQPRHREHADGRDEEHVDPVVHCLEGGGTRGEGSEARAVRQAGSERRRCAVTELASNWHGAMRRPVLGALTNARPLHGCRCAAAERCRRARTASGGSGRRRRLRQGRVDAALLKAIRDGLRHTRGRSWASEGVLRRGLRARPRGGRAGHTLLPLVGLGS